MRIRRSKLFEMLFLGVVLLLYHFFYIVPYQSVFLDGFLFRILVAFLGTVLCICLWYAPNFRFVFPKNYITMRAVSVQISVLLMTFHSILEYPGQSALDTIGLSARFLWILWAIPILYIFNEEKGFEHFLQMLNIISFIWLVIASVQVLVYLVTGLIFLDFESGLGYAAFSRGKLLRINMGPLGNFFLLYNTIILIEANKKLNYQFSILYCVIGWLYMLFVQQTRAYIAANILCVAVLLLSHRKVTWRKFISIVAGIVAVFAVLFSGAFDRFLESFSASGIDSNSTLGRLGAIQYYWGYIRRAPIWAMGFPHEAYYYNLIHGPFSRFFLDDVGLIGTWVQTGVFLIPFFIWPLCRLVFIYRRKRKNMQIFHSQLLLLIISYLIFTIPTLMITDPQRMIIWPLFIALGEYLWKEKSL